jgi:hypothetical protein
LEPPSPPLDMMGANGCGEQLGGLLCGCLYFLNSIN